jgi:hypothetical protein
MRARTIGGWGAHLRFPEHRLPGTAGDNVQRVYDLGLGQAETEVVETSAGEIAAYLAEYAKGKDGKLYSDTTLEIHHP